MAGETEETLEEMKAFARKSFQDAVKTMGRSITPAYKLECEERALKAIAAYAAADTALSLNRR